MALRIQVGPPGSLGAASIGAVGSSPSADLHPAHRNDGPESHRDSARVIEGDSNLMKRVQALEDLAPDSPALRKIINTASIIVDLFKLAMASMLGVFVPQLCPGNEEAFGGPGNCTSIIGPHDCSFEENFRCLVPFNQWVLAINFICMGSFFLHYALVWKRENFCVYNFKESLESGRLDLRLILQEYPTAAIRLHRLNKWLFNISVSIIVLQIVNLISSAYLCFRLYPNGYKTFTTYFTNLLLISIVLKNCTQAAWVGIKHQLAYSAIAFEPVSYNSVNPKVERGV